MRMVEYPPELQSQRLLRKGKGTFAVGCGPLPDDTDWTEIPYAVLKEECAIREMPTGGKAEALAEALTNYKAPESRPPAEDVSQVVGKGKSADGEKRKKKWLDGPDHTYHKKLEAIKNDAICLMSLRENGVEHKFGGPSIEFLMANNRADNAQYRVSICKMPTCDCPAKNFRAQEHCKHIYAVLTNILKVPEPLVWQNAFLADELEQFFKPILQASNDGAVSDRSVGLLANGNCPICFQETTDVTKPTVECSDCRIKVHKRCFNILAMNTTGYGLKCVACLSKWTEPGQWGAEGVEADDRAIAEAKEAAKALKAAEKAAEKEAKARKKRSRVE